MSRSYKKHGYDGMCSSYGDKYCRTIYHRCDRRKTNQILKEVTVCYESADKEELTKGNAFDNSICLVCMDCDEEICYEDGVYGEVPFEKYMGYYPCKDANICHEFCVWSHDYEIIADKLITKGKDYSLRFADKWSWASDGGNYFSEDRSTAHRHLDISIFGNPAYKVPWKAKTFWERYTEERDAKHRCGHPMRFVTVNYRIQHGYVSCFSYDDWHEIQPNYEYKQITFQEPYKKGYFTVPDWVYSQIGKGEITGYYTAKKRSKKHLAHSDWWIDDFMLYRNILPQTFETADELYEWIHKHEEHIISSWLKIKFRK